MSVSIQVAIRTRPFTVDDRLGVIMSQSGEETGDVNLINCDYTTTQFPFTYSWWSAYGYKRHCDEKDMFHADGMKLIDQEEAYSQVGQKVKADVLSGSAVVLFAYGLSGSGKTYTVFGPDAVDAPEAWFKHATPQPLWGILPRLAFELFEMKGPDWKITMKYFQNVVDTVRDLMSPTGEEQQYKSGMRKDPDGFMDIEWCDSKVIGSWSDLRKTFQIANGRKAIAPTQFNPMSTRGHCIMMLEVEMPNPSNPETKQRGRIYVCDLAGTEPAGDIVYANYEKHTFDDGSFEYKFMGAHSDKKKTKELQDQGKKINLSLSEMAQFFMKMAEGVIKKTLKPGMSIPGCNSFFLCKYLKDTMLQARTYLFCAIRPEMQFLKYTFSTLGFAKNASVVKLVPKKATTAASAAERKLMAELEQMKLEMEQMRKAAAAGGGGGGGGGGNSDESNALIAELQAQLAAKADAVAGGGESGPDPREQQQKEEYARRGIALAVFEEGNTDPYFTNIDDDAFRHNRFMYLLRKPVTVFGNKGDVQLMSLAVLKDHCKVRMDGAACYIVGGKGDTFLNGKIIKEGQEAKVAVFDRLAVGDQLMMFRWPGKEEGAGDQMAAEDAVAEFQDGLVASRSGGGAGNQAQAAELEGERQKIMAERAQWEQEKQQNKSKRDEEEYQRAMAAVDNSILDLLPKAKEAKQQVDLMGRVSMSFDVVLEKGADQIPKVKISVENSQPKLSILIDPQEFLPKLSLLKDEMMKLKNAIDSGREYELPMQHDPLFLMFDNDFLLGTATHWPEYLMYNLETDEEERMQDIKNAAVPYNNVGLLEVKWTPLAGPEEKDWASAPRDIESEDDLLGKPWTYRLEIKRAADLPVFCEMAYVSYDFFGDSFTTEAVQQQTYSPVFEYSRVHHIAHVTPEFIAYLKGSIEMQIHITQHLANPPDKVGTSNPIVVESIQTGEPKGYAHAAGKRPKSDFEVKNEQLTAQLQEKTQENDALKAKVQQLEARLLALEGSGLKKELSDAKALDASINGAS